MGNSVDLSIIFINYNAVNLTMQAVHSVLSTIESATIEIIVVENGDNPEECYPLGEPRLQVLRNIPNKGFGHACNVGASVAQGMYLLFLNNDTILHPHTIDDSVCYMREHLKTGALGVQILLPSGKLDHGCKRGFPTPMASFCYFTKLDRIFQKNKTVCAYRQGFVPQDAIAPVDAVSGAFLLVSAQLFQLVGGFDETFFMYGEDLDLCYRIKQIGYQNIYYGATSITHLKGQSGLHTKNEKVLYEFYHSMELFYDKHYKHKYGIIVSSLVKAAIKLKYEMAKQALKKGKND
ncbi:MAG: glycosyltransferase family 2 protein [Hydrogenoanaerobacterium sp.]